MIDVASFGGHRLGRLDGRRSRPPRCAPGRRRARRRRTRSAPSSAASVVSDGGAVLGQQRDGGAGDRRATLGGQDATFEAAGAGRRLGRRRERCRVRARGGVGRGRGGDGRGIEGVAIADARRDRLVALARGLEGELLDGVQRRRVQLVAGGADHLGVGQRAVGADRQLEIDGGAFGRRRVRPLRLDELRHARRRHRRRGRGTSGVCADARGAATPLVSNASALATSVHLFDRVPGISASAGSHQPKSCQRASPRNLGHSSCGRRSRTRGAYSCPRGHATAVRCWRKEVISPCRSGGTPGATPAFA